MMKLLALVSSPAAVEAARPRLDILVLPLPRPDAPLYETRTSNKTFQRERAARTRRRASAARQVLDT